MRAVCCGVGAAAELEPVLGAREAQLVEEDLRELVVVVLAGVDHHLVAGLAQRLETAAALTNCGRLPITVRTLTDRGNAGQR